MLTEGLSQSLSVQEVVGRNNLSDFFKHYELAWHQLDIVYGKVLPESLFSVLILVQLFLQNSSIDFDKS